MCKGATSQNGIGGLFREISKPIGIISAFDGNDFFYKIGHRRTFQRR